MSAKLVFFRGNFCSSELCLSIDRKHACWRRFSRWCESIDATTNCSCCTLRIVTQQLRSRVVLARIVFQKVRNKLRGSNLYWITRNSFWQNQNPFKADTDDFATFLWLYLMPKKSELDFSRGTNGIQSTHNTIYILTAKRGLVENFASSITNFMTIRQMPSPQKLRLCELNVTCVFKNALPATEAWSIHNFVRMSNCKCKESAVKVEFKCFHVGELFVSSDISYRFAQEEYF